jgi:hypothetical protein
MTDNLLSGESGVRTPGTGNALYRQGLWGKDLPTFETVIRK